MKRRRIHFRDWLADERIDRDTGEIEFYIYEYRRPYNDDEGEGDDDPVKIELVLHMQLSDIRHLANAVHNLARDHAQISHLLKAEVGAPR
jgi:hypothetical protein